jgi:hypothetical protein
MTTEIPDSDKWRDKPPTKKQYRMAHALLSKALSQFNRGQVSDYIEMMMKFDFVGSDKNHLELSEEEYQELRADLEKKKKTWKWREDLK